MHRQLSLFLFLSAILTAAPEWVVLRTVGGNRIEGQTLARSVRLDGKDIPLAQILSIHGGQPASMFEAVRIKNDLLYAQSEDKDKRDDAIEDLTLIGIPVMTPLLQSMKDTDQHEPRPLYRLFERIMPSYADSFDRTLSLVRLANGDALRGKLPDGEAAIELKDAEGKNISVKWAQIRLFAVRRKLVQRNMQAHSLSHSTQIEYLDTGVVLTKSSKVDISARGLVRLSWDTDSWASDADGLKQPGSPAYKSNMVDGQPFGALVGRMGVHGEPFFVGKKATITDKIGRLGLAVNDNKHWQNNVGSFYIKMTATDAYDVGDAQ